MRRERTSCSSSSWSPAANCSTGTSIYLVLRCARAIVGDIDISDRCARDLPLPRKCTDTIIGIVLVRFAGHFQCSNINIVFKQN